MTNGKLKDTDILFLSWESPWPAYGGGALRTLGLLKELSKGFSVHLVVFSQKGLSEEQKSELRRYVDSITFVPMASSTLVDNVQVAVRMFSHQLPYHCALLDISFERAPEILNQLRTFPGVVYANFGHWGTLVRGYKVPNWILDQQNADVHFWRVYAGQVNSWSLKLAALVNWRLAAKHFPRIYASVGHIISVCEEDRQLTLELSPQTQVDVIENGVDCTYYFPDRTAGTTSFRLLFTGTSAPRNVTALSQFVNNVWPLVRQEFPQIELLVAGNFKPDAQVAFKKYENVRFTGKVDDMRPYFNQSDVFVASFEETHGSKLKIAEAMAMGIPIVSTPEGIRGFSLVEGESVLVARDKEQFASQIASLLNDPNKRERIGNMARHVALATIDWQVLGQRLIQKIQAVHKKLV